MSELLLIFVVALIVFGPDKLPQLAQHLGQLVKKIYRLKQQALDLWQEQTNELQLKDNERKAKLADEQYQQQKTD